MGGRSGSRSLCDRTPEQGIEAMVRNVFVLGALLAASALGNATAEGDRALFENTCSQCHALSKVRRYGPRSPEQWKHLVARMRQIAQGGSKAFSEATAARISTYLGSEAGSRAGGNSASPASSVGPGAAPSAAAVQPAAGRMEKHAESLAGESGEAHDLGALLGAGAGLFLLALIGSGVARRRLKRRFHAVHIGLVTAFACLLGAHAILLFLQFGPARSFWHGSGAAALGMGIVTAGVGRLRRRIGRRFLPIHKTLAFSVLVLAVLHRLLA